MEKQKKKKIRHNRPSQSSGRSEIPKESQMARIEESVHATINFDVVRRSADTNTGEGVEGGGKG